MNLITIGLETVESEARRVSRLDTSDFKSYFGNIKPRHLAQLWTAIDDFNFRRKLSECLDVSIVSKALEMLRYELKAELLKYMNNKRRLRVVRTWYPEKLHAEIGRLEDWQDMEDKNWANHITDTRIMTDRLPQHYPSTMEKCSFCLKRYSCWQSIWILNCQKHSLCETHDTTEGNCNICDSPSQAVRLSNNVGGD